MFKISAFRAASVATTCGRRFFSADKKPVIGFVGLGLMGIPMSSNLVKKGAGKFSKILLYDVNKEAARIFADANPGVNAQFVNSPAEVADGASVIFTMLPNSSHVREVYMDGKDAFLGATRPGTKFIMSSTIDKNTIIDVSLVFQEKAKADVIDAPVSGGVIGAKAGTLTFMVGAEKSLVSAVEPWLMNMGSRVVHCGQPGMGQVAKICNNMLLGVSMIATSEALRLAKINGLDPKLMTSIINTSTGRCWSSDTCNPAPGVMEKVPAASDYQGGFAVGLMQKDMALAMDLANKSFASVGLSAAANEIYKHIMLVPGLKKKDFSVVYQWLAQRLENFREK